MTFQVPRHHPLNEAFEPAYLGLNTAAAVASTPFLPTQTLILPSRLGESVASSPVSPECLSGSEFTFEEGEFYAQATYSKQLWVPLVRLARENNRSQMLEQSTLL